MVRRQAPIEDGLDIVLVQINRVKALGFDNRFFIEKAHNTIPLPRLQRRQIFVVTLIIQYRPALCKAGGRDFSDFGKPTELGPSRLLLKRDNFHRSLPFPPAEGIIRGTMKGAYALKKGIFFL